MFGIAVCAVVLILINLILWVILFAKFRNLIGVEKTLEKIRGASDEIVSNVDRHASRNIQLLDEKIAELKAVSAESERRVAILRNELALVENSNTFQEQLAKVSMQKKNMDKKQALKYSPYNSLQGDLFDQIMGNSESESEDESVSSDEVQKILNQPRISIAEKKLDIKKDLPTEVKKLNANGVSVEEIARQTGKSVPEIKLILQFA